MKYQKTTAAGSYEILACDEFKAIPKAITGSTVVKAGTPITAAGAAIAAGTNAVGVLLYDVDPAANPNGAVVVEGMIDVLKAKAASGISSYPVSTLKSAVPTLIFREDVTVQA